MCQSCLCTALSFLPFQDGMKDAEYRSDTPRLLRICDAICQPEWLVSRNTDTLACLNNAHVTHIAPPSLTTVHLMLH